MRASKPECSERLRGVAAIDEEDQEQHAHDRDRPAEDTSASLEAQQDHDPAPAPGRRPKSVARPSRGRSSTSCLKRTVATIARTIRKTSTARAIIVLPSRLQHEGEQHPQKDEQASVDRPDTGCRWRRTQT